MATSSRSSAADTPPAVWRYAGTLDDLWEGEVRGVNLGGVDVVLCNVDGELFAYEDRCPHLANPLSHGVLNHDTLRCAAHEWEFDARTGHGVNPQSRASETLLGSTRRRADLHRDTVRIPAHGRRTRSPGGPGAARHAIRARGGRASSKTRTTTSLSATKGPTCACWRPASAACPGRRWRPQPARPFGSRATSKS